MLVHRGGQYHELAREYAKRWHPEDRERPQRESPADGGIQLHEPADAFHVLRPGFLRGMADGEEDRALRERVHRHVQEAGESRYRSAHAEGEGDDAHMLDRGIREHALDVALPVFY